MALRSSLTIDRRRIRNWTLLLLEGELDLWSAPVLRSILVDEIDDGHQSVAAEISSLHDIDALGLSLFLSAHDSAAHLGREFLVLYPAPKVLRLLKRAGLAARLPVIGSSEMFDDDPVPRLTSRESARETSGFVSVPVLHAVDLSGRTNIENDGGGYRSRRISN
jgi:anti-sigma B factor antagonist